MKTGIKIRNTLITFIMVSLLALMTVACGQNVNQNTDSGNSQNGTQYGDSQSGTAKKEVNNIEGKIRIDGSNTLFPILDAITKEFNKTFPNIDVHIGVAGTTGGIRNFMRGKLDIVNASSPFTDVQAEDCKEQGVEYSEFKIAYDGIVIAVNKDNTWVDSITVEELQKIWASDSTAKKWKDINPKWPDADIKLIAPESETQFFSEVINGDQGNIRPDFTQINDGKALEEAIDGDKNAMGIIGYEVYSENSDTMKVLGVDTGSGAVKPDLSTIKGLSYKPLSRPLYLYVNKKSLENESVKEFINFAYGDGSKLVKEAGFIPLDDYKTELSKLNNR